MLSEKYEQALCLAADLHRTQTRKSTDIPYLSHLMAVSSMVIEACDQVPEFDCEDLAIAALLHDTLEDQGHKITLEDIEQKFGSLVARIVDDCSDAVIESEGQEKPPWKQRKLAYIARIASKSRETPLVSCADKLHATIKPLPNGIGAGFWPAAVGAVSRRCSSACCHRGERSRPGPDIGTGRSGRW